MKKEGYCSILVVDDDSDVLYTAKLVLRGIASRVDTLQRPEYLPGCMKSCKYDVILLDMNLTRGITSGRDGIEWLGRILEIDPDAKVITTTAYGDIDLAVRAMRMGSVDFIIKPWNKEQLVTSVKNALSTLKAKKEPRHSNGRTESVAGSGTKYPEIITRSYAMMQVLETVRTVAPTNANVLILGENGTGKEVIAWSLHKGSARSDKQFVHVDLGAIPETLFESELFGHTRGAFTDAKEERTGRFETASGGTLFLDEIGNLSMPMQAKILTAVQNREIIRIGTNHPVAVDVRIISATNMPLYQMADSIEFRQDLLYRLNTVEINVLPLRERREDIGQLTDYFLNLYANQYEKHNIGIAEETRLLLLNYHWPGNIRELAHTVERAVILNRSGMLGPEDFVLRAKPRPVPIAEEYTVRIEDYERKAITVALNKHNGNLSKAAGELGVARTTLYRKIAHFDIDQ